MKKSTSIAIALSTLLVVSTNATAQEWDPWIKAAITSRDIDHRPGGDSLDQDSAFIEARIGAWDALPKEFSWFVDVRAVASTDDTALLDENTDFVREDSSGDSYFLQVREAYLRYHGLTRLPDEHLTLGLQRIDDIDGLWLDADVESLVWRGETTQLNWQVGIGKEFDTFRTDADLLSINDDVTRSFASFDWDWTAYHSIGLAYMTHSQSTDLDANIFGNTALGYNPDIRWSGVRIMSNWQERRSPQAIAYKAEWIKQSGDTSRVAADGSITDVDVDADAIDLGVRFDQKKWSAGITYTRGSGGESVNQNMHFSQSGLQSNRGRYFGVRQRLYRFNEALRADITNIAHTGLFASWQPNEHWEGVLLLGRYVKDNAEQDIFSFGRAIETVAGNDDLGTSIDINVTHYAYDTNPYNLNLVRFRVGAFSPGDAFVDQSTDYRITLEAQFRF